MIQPPKSSNKNNYVYIIKMKDFKIYKIGKSSSLYHRLKSLQTSSPFDLDLLAYSEYKNIDKQESMLHERFEKYHIRGEWYRLPIETAERIIYEMTFDNKNFIISEDKEYKCRIPEFKTTNVFLNEKLIIGIE